MPDQVQLNLALQGGGAHGAFTWGVLDTLLACPNIGIEGISGTSAGAMNAICLAQGWMTAGREGARQALRHFWEAIADSSPFPESKAEQAMSALPAGLQAMLRLTDYFTPNQLNPFNLNPLREVVRQQFDFERLRTHSPFRLFIATTLANSGQLHLIREHEISEAGLLASACLPTLHHTVEVDGEPRWDGGYSANPAIYPLIFDCRAPDLLMILLSPFHYRATPHSASDIRRRLQDIAFNAHFLREMRMLADLRERLPPRWCRFSRLDRRLGETRFHLINDEIHLGNLPPETRLTASRRFFTTLFEAGQRSTIQWLDRHHAKLGRKSTVNLTEQFG